MELSNKLFEVGTVSIADLEEYMNELAEEGRTLHSVHQTGGGSSAFTVITYVSYDWALAGIQDNEKKWAAKIAENNGGHANE